ncbi:MAG TPA: NADH-quinone oxidoreductase subunit C [Candidatus Sphingobacterium stercoripullorum]|uniref:NADH-quinone oxidoreductase subunit C n=1 Tax=Candidatus Sphingobacterium stercoripullorum TaxID=2838759 RepID=A0A9D1W8J8_9SPHI|nr:NADH-quinone oxidoreductase subunit C [Candidatus Sphingobacterium stercoripullorum]
MDKIDINKVGAKLEEVFADKVQIQGEPQGILQLQVDKKYIIELLGFLKNDPELKFIFLTDITAVHYPDFEEDQQMCVVYHIHSLENNIRVRIKVFINGDNPTIDSATVLWNGANWMERETFDFFGVKFLGHPDLRRILNIDELNVHPMRKEYPLEDPNRVDKKDFYFGR